ncbi:TetR/AcrR family transcriptional regulator [Sungkyunkwania multivorans]|uniref:TetR/AcrR family transcriptional regulator n=1 Tax=Sungkyunkwania multivorans TaxID=1173618 RepID=A0ABW3D3J2_9FLAO
MKEKIIKNAIALFNEHSISSVSMKQIADTLKISAGNLQYHFKNKEALLFKIYEEMHQEALHYILPENKYITLHHFEEMMLKFDDLQQRYQFFFNDIVHIIKKYPSIGKLHETSNLIRFREGRKLIDYYVESGRMAPETDGVDYDKVVFSVWMISTFWQSQRQVIQTSAYQINKCPSIEMLWNLLIPYLSEKGWEEYQQIRKFVKLPTK